MRLRTIVLTTLFLSSAAALPRAEAQVLQFQGWGLRAGISDDPNQVMGGIHADMGELFEQLRIQPNAELAVGSDLTRVGLNLDALWMLDTPGKNWRPYVGGELALTYLNFEVNDPRIDDTSSEVGLLLVGGVEVDLVSTTRVMAELKIGVSDAPDLQVLGGFFF